MIRFTIILLLSLCATATPAHAQAPVFGDASTQPGKGRFTVRETATFTRFDHAPDGTSAEAQQWELNTNITAGVTGRFSVSLDLPLVFRDLDAPTGEERFHTLGDFTLLARYRLHQEDLGPVDTWRVMAIAGVELPSGASGVSSDSVDPVVGIATMLILGRHGLNASARWKFNTGNDTNPLSPGDGEHDALRYDASYAYRLAPEAYKADTKGALYFIAELSGLYETNGDHELFLGPTLLWEARTYALEIGIQVPIEQSVDERFEREYRFVAGFRLLF